MATIFPHLGTVLASPVLSAIPFSAALHAVTQAAGTTVLVIVILIVVVLVAVGQAVRALVDLAAAFLQVVVSVTSLLVVTAISAVVIVFLLVHP